MMRSYPVGDEIQAQAVFQNRATGAPVNPQTVIFRLKDPTGTETQGQVTNPAVGVYRCLFTPTIPGYWSSRWEGTGNGADGAMENQFEVQPSAFTNPG